MNRSSVYYEPRGESEENLELMRQLDELYMLRPYYGSRRMTAVLQDDGYEVNRKRVQRLMRLMGIEALYPRRRTTVPSPGHKVYPYLLRGVAITAVDQVWSTDITYIGLRGGFLYLVAVMDWFSRYVLSWELSNSMDVHFCLDALCSALSQGEPEVFNSDQGSQFTSESFTGMLRDRGITISMDGRGRAFDNIWIERLWRSLKYEEVYLKDYEGASEAWQSISEYFRFYNTERPHQSLGYQTPAAVYFGRGDGSGDA